MSAVAQFGALIAAGVNLNKALEIAQLDIDGSRPLETILHEAIYSGSPLAAVTKQLVAFEMDLERFKAELETSNAVPIATRKLLLWLPVLSLVMSQLAGFGTLASLFHPIGIVAFGFAMGLILLGARWSNHLLAPLRAEPQHPALELMKFNLRISSGAPLQSSRDPALQTLIELSRQTGAPLGQLVENEIQLLTQRASTEAITKAKKMAIDLLIPLALTVLPAFLILTVVPMLIGFGL